MKPTFHACRILTAAGLFSLLAGCSTLDLPGASYMNYPGKTALSGDFPAKGPIVPDTTLNLTKNLQIPLDKIVTWGLYAGAAWLILDPLAPNWEIEQADFPDRHFHLSLKMKRVYAGGAGEARQAFHQRAKDLMRQNGYEGYSVVEYSEGLESSVLGSQRVARGVVQLTRRAAG